MDVRLLLRYSLQYGYIEQLWRVIYNVRCVLDDPCSESVVSGR